MAGGTKNEGGRGSRGNREDDRKEKKAAARQPAKPDVSELSEMIKRRSQSSVVNRKKRNESSSDSDAGESRFKTPSKKRKLSSSPGRAPKKEKKKNDEVSEESGDEIHRRSKGLMKAKSGLDLDYVDFEDAAAVKKEILSLRKKLKSSLKQQTIKISLDLDRKNKELEKEVAVLKKESRREDDGKVKKLRDERDEALDKVAEFKKTLVRIRSERNKAEEKEDKFKKETNVLIKEVRGLREDLKKKEDEVLALKKLLKSLVEDDDDDEVVWTEGGKDDVEAVLETTIVKGSNVNEADSGKQDALTNKQSNGVESYKTNKPEVDVKGGDLTNKPSNLGSDDAKKVGDDAIDLTKTKDLVADANENPIKDVVAETSKDASKEEGDIEGWSSGQDWEGESYFKVGKYLVNNVKRAKESLAVGVKMPLRIVKETKRFTGCSLNNRIVFIATNAKSRSHHNPAMGNPSCGLEPACPRKWKEGEPIAKVLIIGSDWHPKNETEQWVCVHHQDASLHGNNLQIQKLSKSSVAKKAVVEKIIDPFKGLDDLKKKMNTKGGEK